MNAVKMHSVIVNTAKANDKEVGSRRRALEKERMPKSVRVKIGVKLWRKGRRRGICSILGSQSGAGDRGTWEAGFEAPELLR